MNSIGAINFVFMKIFMIFEVVNMSKVPET